MKLIREIGAFFKSHWLHGLLVVPAIVGVTVVHEGMHGLAVRAQGGTIRDFVWLPTSGEWGHIRYVFASSTVYSSVLIALAPYLLWLALILLAVLLAFFNPPRSFRMASTVFIWLFLVPLADIANTALPYLSGTRNDFQSALGAPAPAIQLALLAAGGFFAALGFFVQRRLYGARRLSLPAYASLGALAALTICLISC